jgi:hypothetical protein
VNLSPEEQKLVDQLMRDFAAAQKARLDALHKYALDMEFMKLNAGLSARQGVQGAQQPIPKREPRPVFPGSCHNLDCKSNIAAELYDSACLRCGKIKKVISLRRKQMKYGASIAEAKASYELAGKIIDEFGLTRGETFDKKYADVAIPPAPRPKVTRRKATDELTDEDFEQVI